MTTYIHDLEAWPAFHWHAEALSGRLADVRHRQGRMVGRMESLGVRLRSEAVLATLTRDVVKSSDIEGEVLDDDQVRSSIARRLGIDIGALAPMDRDVEGVVEMMLDATQQYDLPLTKARLLAWHIALFPDGVTNGRTGEWRDDSRGPMQVVSGGMGRERIHFQAPPAGRVDGEMTAFLAWFNNDASVDPVLKAALAHLWFVTIHPFDDGNGRIARAIADMALARSERSAQRFYSMSAQVRLERKSYYRMLESTQHGDLDVTAWLDWFLHCLDRAIVSAEEALAGVLRKAEFWKSRGSEHLNPRQRKMLNRILDGFEGQLTSSKWARATGTSPDTALRDIADLVDRGILARESAGGRSTSYLLTT